jgi:hypothetical protein
MAHVRSYEFSLSAKRTDLSYQLLARCVALAGDDAPQAFFSESERRRTSYVR